MAREWWYYVTSIHDMEVALWGDESPSVSFKQFLPNTNPVYDWVILMDTDEVFVMMFHPLGGDGPIWWVSASRERSA